MAIPGIPCDLQVQQIKDQLRLDPELQIETVFQEGSPLCVEKNGLICKITYGQKVSLFRGLGLLAEHSDEKVYKTQQTPRFSLNGVMMDCSRNGVMNIAAVKEMIRYMALMGHNMLMLYTEDTYEVPEYPYFGYMRGRYTQKELQELDDYAAGFGIEMIPCIQTLAHLSPTLRWECFDPIKDTDDILLCGDERTYAFIEAMIRACRNSFRTDRIHIGMDEAFMLGLGRYREEKGFRPREEVFCEHLIRVNEICQKYGFRPMIWSDMFYRIASAGSYNASVEIPEHVRKMVPPQVELVYWEYSMHEKDSYRQPLLSHLQFQNNLIFAGGSWRWLGFTPHIAKSQEATRAALEACLENGVREVFCTAWGDDGNEAPFFTVLSTLQLYAEYSYQGTVNEEELAKRLKTCTGESLSDMMLLDLPDMPDGVYHRIETNPSCYLLYSDVLGSVFEKHCEPCYQQNYASYGEKLMDAAKRSPNHGYMYEMLAELCFVLSLKSCVSADAYDAYQAGDREKLQEIATKTLPAIISRMESFRDAVEKRWFRECKRSGFDVLDFRFGGVSARAKSAIRQIQAYLNGELHIIEELEDSRLPFNNKTDEELKEDPVMCWGIRRHLFTPNRLVW